MNQKMWGFLFLSFIFLTTGHTQKQAAYSILKTFPIRSNGWWDYIAVYGGKLYVSHGTQVNILDKNTGDSLGIIPNTEGVHGIAFDSVLNKGYTSNGRSNNITVFDLNTNSVITQLPTGENPDAILYEPYSKTIITCNERSKDLSVIDSKQAKVIATIPVGGKPETAVSDKAGKLFVNIEDKNEIVVVDTKTFKVLYHWSIAPGESPTGLSLDNSTHRLFAGRDNKLLMVDAQTGNLIDKLPIGEGCDGVAFNSNERIIFTANGEGTLTAIHEDAADRFKMLGNFSTKQGARTLALDNSTGLIYLPTAEFEPSIATEKRPQIKSGTFQVLVVQ